MKKQSKKSPSRRTKSSTSTARDPKRALQRQAVQAGRELRKAVRRSIEAMKANKKEVAKKAYREVLANVKEYGQALSAA